MDRKRPAEETGEGEGVRAVRKKVRKLGRKEGKKTLKMMQVYKMIEKEIKKLSEREIPMGADYNEAAEEAAETRLSKLTLKHLQIHKYLTRHELLVDDDGEKVKECDARRTLVIAPTSNDKLNELLTKHVNQKPPHNEALFVGRYSHVTVEDVRRFVEEVRKSGEAVTDVPEEPSELEHFIENVACEANKQVKRFIEEDHKESISLIVSTDGKNEANGEGEFGGAELNTEAEGRATEPEVVPTWDSARIELMEAIERGDLKVDEGQRVEECETSMPITAEEAEDEDEEESDLDGSDFPSFGESTDPDDKAGPSGEQESDSDSSTNTIELSDSESDDDREDGGEEGDDEGAGECIVLEDEEEDEEKEAERPKAPAVTQETIQLSGSEDSRDVVLLDSSDGDN